MDAATIIEPERHFVGCLLSLPYVSARTVLAGMRATDVADPASAHALQLVIEVVAAGRDPSPVAVFGHAVTTGQAPGEQRRSRLALWLAETYEAVQLPTQAPWLKAVVLEQAWRRAVGEYGERLVQATEDSSTEVLARLAADTGEPGELWNRYQRALDGDRERPTRLGVAA